MKPTISEHFWAHFFGKITLPIFLAGFFYIILWMYIKNSWQKGQAIGIEFLIKATQSGGLRFIKTDHPSGLQLIKKDHQL